LRHDDPVESFAFHIRARDTDILRHLILRAFEPGSSSGIFHPDDATASLAK
jgi:hypothetical protein